MNKNERCCHIFPHWGGSPNHQSKMKTNILRISKTGANLSLFTDELSTEKPKISKEALCTFILKISNKSFGKQNPLHF